MSKGEVRAYNGEFKLEDQKINGMPIVFDSESKTFQAQKGKRFVEVIKKEAIEFCIANGGMSDIVFNVNHDDDKILARSSERLNVHTMSWELEEGGVSMSAMLADTFLARDVKTGAERGDYEGLSFKFWVAKGGESWEHVEGDLYKRTITKIIKVADFSIVTTTGYDAAKLDLEERAAQLFVEEPSVRGCRNLNRLRKLKMK